MLEIDPIKASRLYIVQTIVRIAQTMFRANLPQPQHIPAHDIARKRANGQTKTGQDGYTSRLVLSRMTYTADRSLSNSLLQRKRKHHIHIKMKTETESESNQFQKG